MKKDLWYDRFLNDLYKKFPHKPQLTEELMDLLSIEREAVYRRLRKEVKFPVDEIAEIASAWDISLDEIIGIGAHFHTFKVCLVQYLNPTKEQLKFIQEMVNFIDAFSESPNPEYMEVSNVLPRTLTSGFPQLARFYIFKCAYKYSNYRNALPFSQVIPDKKVCEIAGEYYRKAKNIATINYVWDPMLFQYLVNDITYFCSIYLITEEEKQLLKADLHALLDYMSEVSIKGCFPETNNNVNLYISQINIDTGYSYFHSDTIQLSQIRAFIKHEMNSTNEELANSFRTWMNLTKRTSIQISGVDEKRRIEFFMKQRQIIDSL